MSWPTLDLPLLPPFPPMEARLVHAVPVGDAWSYEPKWDGFRCLAFKDDAKVALQSKSGQPLARYFPEVVDTVSRAGPPRLVLDGELVIPAEGGYAFEPLLQRIHPAASRVARLAAETPARLLAFDLLVAPDGRLLTGEPLEARRTEFARIAPALASAGLELTSTTRDRSEAERWLAGAVRGIDGVIAKRLDAAYASGERAMQKVKRLRTVDCVVGGLRWATGRERGVGSLLLGLYDDTGLLQYVGHAASFDARTRAELADAFEPIVAASGPGGFTGDAPGGPSRWARERSTEWVPVRPECVVEVEVHHASGGRFRHGTRLVRFRPDKDPRSCTMEQLEG